MAMPGFIAIDEIHNDYVYLNRFPRKELMEYMGVKSAHKMYVDRTDGTASHIGYVVGGGWFRIFRIAPFKKEA